MEKLIAQAQVYYIIGFGRDSSIYDDKKWILGRVYLTNKRMIFRYMGRIQNINYGDIVSVEEKDKYFRISPPIGWSRGNIIEIRHYEDETRKHVLTTLISSEYDVNSKFIVIISKFAIGEETKFEKVHKKILLLLSLGIRDSLILGYLIDSEKDSVGKILDELRMRGLINESFNPTEEGRKIVEELRKEFK